MSELLRFFKDMRDNGYGLAEIAAQLGTSAIAEPVAGFAAMYDPQHGADAIREGMTYQPRTQEAQEYSQSIGNAAKTAIKPAMPIIDTWKKGVDIAGQYSPVVGAGLRTVPTAIGIAMGAKPALQAGRQVSEGLGAMQGRMIANANAPSTLNTAGFRGQRGAIGTQRPLTEFEQAHLLAQQRAALPVSQGGLGLAPDNTAMDRARAMGFDTEAYHGTGADIDGFTKRFLKNDKKTYLYDIGIHGSLKPETANMYAEYSQYPTLARNMSAGLESGNQVVYPLLAKSGNTLDATKKLPQVIEDKILEKGDEFFKTRRRKSVQLKHIYPQDLLQELQPKMGRKPLRDFINNELGYDSVKYQFQGDNLVVTKPNQLRSRFAAFDPFNRESSNLLAQSAKLAPTTALGAYMYNEKRKKSQGKQ